MRYKRDESKMRESREISKSESIMQDNAILQRTLYKYEQTIADFDSVLRGSRGGDMAMDLKKIAEKQLKEIVMLQKEIEIVKYNSNQQLKTADNTRRKPENQMELDNRVWS